SPTAKAVRRHPSQRRGVVEMELDVGQLAGRVPTVVGGDRDRHGVGRVVGLHGSVLLGTVIGSFATSGTSTSVPGRTEAQRAGSPANTVRTERVQVPWHGRVSDVLGARVV